MTTRIQSGHSVGRLFTLPQQEDTPSDLASDACFSRVRSFARWLAEREEREIAVVTHCAPAEHLPSERAPACASQWSAPPARPVGSSDPLRLSLAGVFLTHVFALLDATGELKAPFGNAELRVATLLVPSDKRDEL